MNTRSELRLAVSMNGGVSLAVWMGGVTRELLELIRSTPVAQSDSTDADSTGGYGLLTGVVGQRVRVDIVAGASAGGINGALLGIAVANNVATLDMVRSVWLENGDLADLVHSPTKKSTSSLLDGDKFRDNIRNALRDVQAKRGESRGNQKIWVEMTLTALDGIRTSTPDDVGTFVIDTDYEATLWFDEEHFIDPVALDALATAVRASASFPAAFEPVELDITDRPGNLLRSQLVPQPPSEQQRLWVVDGGTLNNKPIDRVLNKIFEQPATGPVRRVVTHIVPDPGGDITKPPRPKDQGDRSDTEPPSLGSILWKSLVAMPRHESVRGEIEQIAQNNSRARAFSSFRWTLAARLDAASIGQNDTGEDRDPDQLVQLATPLLETFKHTASERSASRSWDRIQHAVRDLGMQSLTQSLDDEVMIRLLATQRAEHYPKDYFARTKLAEHGEPVAGAGDQYWGYGLNSAKRVAAAVIDVIHGVAAVVRPVKPIADASAALHLLQASAHQQLERIAAVDTSSGHIAMAAKGLGGASDLEEWAAKFYNDWQAQSKPALDTAPTTKSEAYLEVGQAAVECGSLLRAAAPHVETVAAWVGSSGLDQHIRDRVAELAAATRTLTYHQPPPSDGAKAFTGADWTVRQLLAIEMLYSLSGSEVMVPQAVELAQVSAFARDQLAVHSNNSERRSPGEKLTGVRAGHFAAFYLRSWRANDWMWGRLDAADRLTATVFSPDQIAREWMKRPGAELHSAMRTAVVHTGPQRSRLSADLTTRWQQQFGVDDFNIVTKLGAAMSRATNGNVDDRDILGRVRDLIVLRRQAEIAIEEIPHVATALRADLADAGRDGNGEQQGFLDAADRLQHQIDTPEGPSLQTIADALVACRIGEETLQADATSDRFALLGGQSLATLSTVVQGATGWPGMRKLTTPLRGVGLGTYFLASLTSRRRTTQSGPTGLIYLCVFAIAGALYASSFLVPGGGLPLAIAGVIAIMATLLMTVKESGLRGVVILLGCALMIPALVWNSGAWLPNRVDAWIEPRRPFLTVSAAVVAFMLPALVNLAAIDGRSHRFWRRIRPFRVTRPGEPGKQRNS